ncbi:hypothetical protein CXB51_025143 [Gossypium anomalum]|uniref:TIR domain-containing protein n=1 Tax=Gossypium anomalum TaxID=47600 RepID=A0A8J6CQY5_9ROSI|nr:hypothetical protein CXB51_025143 [Gossypium anomalum]
MAASSHQMEHQIFLSFRGEDTRLNFTANLLEALKDTGINQLSQALSRAIAASNLSIIVLSIDYASSKSCLAELSEIMHHNRTQGHIVLPIFYHVDPSDVRNLGGIVKTCFDNHGSTRLDQVQQWKAAFSEVGKLKGWHIEGGKSERPETLYIRDIVEYVTKKLTNSRPDFEELVGIGDQKRMILKLIEQEDCRVIGLWGMGGMGKTALAVAVYKEVSPKFESHFFFQNVREKIKQQGKESLRNELLSELLNEKDIRIDNPSMEFPYQERLNYKKVLIVLDDVSDSDQIDFMGVRHFGRGSKIIVTSRDKQVLQNGGADIIHEVTKLNEKDSLQLFSIFAFKHLIPTVDFQDLSNNFVEYAQGNPLALKVLGAKLYGKSRIEWESKLLRLKEYGLQNVLKDFVRP